MSRHTIAVEQVSATSLAEVILTGAVISAVAETTNLMYTVTVGVEHSENIAPLVRALTRPHRPEMIIRLSELTRA